MSGGFATTVVDALRGFLPRAHRDFETAGGSRSVKIWYGSLHEHYEIQRIPATVLRAAGVRGMQSALEVGFHSEHPDVRHNDAVLAEIASSERTWRRTLGRAPQHGPFVGRAPQRDRWRRVSELWEDPGVDDEGAAVEAAERLAAYVSALRQVVARVPPVACSCWKQASPGDQGR